MTPGSFVSSSLVHCWRIDASSSTGGAIRVHRLPGILSRYLGEAVAIQLSHKGLGGAAVKVLLVSAQLTPLRTQTVLVRCGVGYYGCA